MLELDLECNFESDAVTCEAKWNGSILTYKEGKSDYTRTDETFYEYKPVKRGGCDSWGESWGWEDFISWDELTNPSNGYVKSNSFTGVATVTVKPPKQVKPDNRDNRDNRDNKM